MLKKGYRNLACHYRSNNDIIAAILKRASLIPEKHMFYAELTDEDSVGSMRDEIKDNLGVVNCLLNFAGGSSNGMSWKLNKKEFYRILNIHLISTYVACKTFVPAMRQNEWGRIINVSSIVGSSGVIGASHYAASKAAVNGFSKSLALELASSKITCNTLALGYFDSGIIDHVPEKNLEHIIANTPLKRLGYSTNEVGGIVNYLLGPDANFITGQIIHMDGGLYFE